MKLRLIEMIVLEVNFKQEFFASSKLLIFNTKINNSIAFLSYLFIKRNIFQLMKNINKNDE